MARLAHATGDNEDQMLRLFAGSAHAAREKWDRSDYQQRTLEIGLHLHAGCWCRTHRSASTETAVQDARPSQDGTCSCRCGDHQADVAVLQEKLAAAYAKVMQREHELQEVRAVHSGVMMALSNPYLSAQAKIIAIRVATEVHAVVPPAEQDAHPSKEIFIGTGKDDGGLAARAGCSPSTAGRLLKQLDAAGIVQRSISRTERSTSTNDTEHGTSDTERTSQVVTRVHIAPRAPTLPATLQVIANWRPADGEAPKRGHGGARQICPDCGDAGQTRITTTVCNGCGQTLDSERQTIPPTVPPPSAPPPLC